MSKKFSLNRQGVRDLMKSKEIQTILTEIGSNALYILGEGYSSSLNIGHTRANVNVNADSFKAKRENSKTNSILKAVRR